METTQLPSIPPVYTTDEVILRCLVDTSPAFVSVCNTYKVDFYSDNFIVTSPHGPGIQNAERFDEEEFSIAFSDTVWEPLFIA